MRDSRGALVLCLGFFTPHWDQTAFARGNRKALGGSSQPGPSMPLRSQMKTASGFQFIYLFFSFSPHTQITTAFFPTSL